MRLADHTFTLRKHQDAVLASIEAWVRDRFLSKERAASEVAPPMVVAARGSAS
jgi:hypothetical protein